MEVIKDRRAAQGGEDVETGGNRISLRQQFRCERIATFEGDLAQGQDRVRPETDLRIAGNTGPRTRPRG